LQLQLAPGRRGAHRVEQRRLDIDIARRGGAAGALAADDAAQAQHVAVVGDHRHVGVKRVALAVERRQRLAGPRAAHDKVAGDLVGVEDVERPVEIEGDEIGDVDQRRDRPQADRHEPILQPARARPVAHAADEAAEEERARLVVRPGEMHRDRAAERALDRRRIERHEAPQSGRGEIAGDAAHAEAVGAVGRDLDVEHGIVEASELREGRADRRVRRQLDDAFVIVGQRQLIARHQHAARFDAANGALLQHHAAARDRRAGRREHTQHASPRIGRAAHHLHPLLAGVDDADAQLVGIGMRLGRDDARDGEGRQILGAVLDAVDFQAAHHQRRDDLVERSVRLEMRPKPGERRLHRASPPVKDGTSSGRKP
jgi:hypothetical protein